MADGDPLSARSAKSTPRDGDMFDRAFKSPRKKMLSPRQDDGDALRKSGGVGRMLSSRTSRSTKSGKRNTSPSSSSSGIPQLAPVVWPGHKRPQLDPGTKDVTVATLHEWESIISKAKQMGATQCVLCGLKQDADYVFEGRFVFVSNSPFERLDSWREMHYVTFCILVPQEKKNEYLHGFPQFPRDYFRCGLLVADWFIPHPNMIKDFVAPRAYTEEYLLTKLPEFDKIVARAKGAGQTECALMTVQEQSGYNYELKISSNHTTRGALGSHYTYTLMPEFQCVQDWACRHGYVIDVKVPQKSVAALGGFSMQQIRCSYAWIVVTWALVMDVM